VEVVDAFNLMKVVCTPVPSGDQGLINVVKGALAEKTLTRDVSYNLKNIIIAELL
jgi:hypothetical protein